MFKIDKEYRTIVNKEVFGCENLTLESRRTFYHVEKGCYIEQKLIIPVYFPIS